MPIVAIWWFLLFFSGRAYRGLDGGRETGDDRAAPLGLKRSGKAFLAMTEADWEQGIDVSLKTAFLVTRAFLPAMVEAGYGRIVNVAGACLVR
ncbi:SDR family NAD(P)-dependent oxidoreductase [Mesorhizobium sp. M0859]|uniref:SDR family NAD(P)-dependent oxidoreductase n=1 Tax=Mesorhizobium sp. M0859 TaxID=2957014 RepID=UPI00333C1BB4